MIRARILSSSCNVLPLVKNALYGQIIGLFNGNPACMGRKKKECFFSLAFRRQQPSP